MGGYPYDVPRAVLDAIEGSERILVGTHESPDPDGMGSLLALSLALVERGRHVAVLLDEPVSERLEFLPGLDRLARPRAGEAFDLGVVFDCHRFARLGPNGERMATCRRTLAIDHHPVDDRGSDADVEWILVDAPATTMLVLSLLHRLHDVPLGEDKATNLYAGLLTDTGGFRHANTSHDALLAAADLVGHGADASAIAEQTMYRRRPQGLRLLAESLAAVEYRLGGRFASMTVDSELLARTGGTLDETEGLVSYLTSVEGVHVAALLKQVDERDWRVSLRAQDGVRVDGIARGFGGGGHHRAAAFNVQDVAREDLDQRLVTAVARALEAGSGDR